MTRRTENTPATVPQAQQAGAIPAEWLWVKPCAWTIRMLTALITGVKEQKWFRLIDKVFAERNLWAAFQQVAEKKGAAGVEPLEMHETKGAVVGQKNAAVASEPPLVQVPVAHR